MEESQKIMEEESEGIRDEREGEEREAGIEGYRG